MFQGFRNNPSLWIRRSPENQMHSQQVHCYGNNEQTWPAHFKIKKDTKESYETKHSINTSLCPLHQRARPHSKWQKSIFQDRKRLIQIMLKKSPYQLWCPRRQGHALPLGLWPPSPRWCPEPWWPSAWLPLRPQLEQTGITDSVFKH